MTESRIVLDAAALRAALTLRDLTDPEQGPHALQLLWRAATDALHDAWQCDVRVERASPIVSIADNYDRLHYPPDGAARDVRYTRYVCETALLRTQTSAMIPPLLRRLAHTPSDDVLLACPGLVYRRDSIDRLHTGEPHQLDLWRVARTRELGTAELQQMIALVLQAVLPGREWRAVAAAHPYTVDGLQIDVRDGERWIEIGECGLAEPALLSENGLACYTGLAMGLGLDRIVMLRKGIDDVRVLRASDPRIAVQLLDLLPYRPVSTMPPVRRDLSLVIERASDEESLGDAIRGALGERAAVIERVELLAATPYEALPEAARARLQLRPDQKNALVRVTFRALDRTLTHAECNALRDTIYAAVHRGSVLEWAAR
jgi:phenylalanyl-tRNA synthetase alpha chain